MNEFTKIQSEVAALREVREAQCREIESLRAEVGELVRRHGQSAGLKLVVIGPSFRLEERLGCLGARPELLAS